jgi:hypothetical protein
MTREERNIPGYGYRMAGTEDDEELAAAGIFGADDPMGRINADPLYQQVIEEPLDEDVEDAAEEEEQENQWFGETPDAQPEGGEGGEGGEGTEGGEPTEGGEEGEENVPDDSGQVRDEYMPEEEPAEEEPEE